MNKTIIVAPTRMLGEEAKRRYPELKGAKIKSYPEHLQGYGADWTIALINWKDICPDMLRAASIYGEQRIFRKV